MKTIGIIGTGFVGQAVFAGFSKTFDIATYDSKHGLDFYVKGISSLSPGGGDYYKRLLELVDGPLFVCVPTPMKKSGECDTSIVESVLFNISKTTERISRETKTVVALKSTVPPGTTEVFNRKYNNLHICFNPEFLTERNSIEDFKSQDHIIVGGPHEGTTTIKQMYDMAFPGVPVTKTSSTIAEFVKYLTNGFLAVKVAFANEVQQMCKKMDADYDKVVEYAIKDKRLGTTHWAAPGPDGKFGFGGKCLCKDLNALIALAENLGGYTPTMEGAWNTNLAVRPEKDWESIDGVVSRQ